MTIYVLGISANYHDSAAVLLRDGHVIAAAQEERFTRVKNDPSFPVNAVKFVLDFDRVHMREIDTIAFYDKPFLKFKRLLSTHLNVAPRGIVGFINAIPAWLTGKLLMKRRIARELSKIGRGYAGKILFPEHHLSHAASAFYPSPFESAAIITVDGVGEWATTTIGKAGSSGIEMLRQLDFPHSLGLLYSSVTDYCGFKVNSGEYKLMGLAPYGNRHGADRFKELIHNEIIDLRQDGSFLLNMTYFEFATGVRMCADKKWTELFGVPRRRPEDEITPAYMDLALAIQEVTEEVVFRIAATAKQITNCHNLVMAGGVALNCVANGKLVKTGLFRDIWIQPAAGDAGGALGAALAAWYIGKGKKRCLPKGKDAMGGAYLGPDYSDDDYLELIQNRKAPYRHIKDAETLYAKTAELIANGKVVGWFQGRMEYGPRALGNRSILGDPRSAEMQKLINLKIKYRESFRPFAPSVLEEDIQAFFEFDRPSPYMLFVAPLLDKRRKAVPDHETMDSEDIFQKLYYQRSDIPAVTHVDYSARIQSVNRKTNPEYWSLINQFKHLTGYGLVLNTSFNVRGEPIVCTPEDAYACFMKTDMDCLVMGNFILSKNDQPLWYDRNEVLKEFDLDSFSFI